MRLKSRATLIAGLGVIGVAGLILSIVCLASPREPTYRGKTLSEWIAPFCRQTAKGLDAPGGPEHFEELQPVRQAVKEMGSNAVPFLIARLNHRESGLRKKMRQLLEKQPYGAFRLSNPYALKIRAIRALAILGSDAQPAIPILAGQLADVALSEHSVYALSEMGAYGMRALVEQYTNVPGRPRIRIALILISPTSMYRGENATYNNYETNEATAAVITEGLLRVAQDRAFRLEMAAIQRLGGYGPMASNAVPSLVKMLKDEPRTAPMARWSMIRALGQIRSQPEMVVPTLTNLLNDPDPATRSAAAQALRAFGYDVPVQSSVRPTWPVAPGRTNQIRYY